MTEIYDLLPPELHADEAPLKPVDIEALREKFEIFGMEFRRYRTVVVNDDRSRTMYEAFLIPIDGNTRGVDKNILHFGHMASILGYRPTMSSIVIPDTRRLFGGEGQTRPVAMLFLEHTEMPSDFRDLQAQGDEP